MADPYTADLDAVTTELRMSATLTDNPKSHAVIKNVTEPPRPGPRRYWESYKARLEREKRGEPMLDPRCHGFWAPGNWPGGRAPASIELERQLYLENPLKVLWRVKIDLWVPMPGDASDDLWWESLTAPTRDLTGAIAFAEERARGLERERDEFLAEWQMDKQARHELEMAQSISGAVPA